MSEAKAKELIDKADKKLKSWLSFGGNKYEDAEELYTKAANQLKVAKQWDAAGAAFEKSAQCHVKLQSPHDAASSYQDAALCYKKTNTQQAVMLYKEVVSIHIDLGRFTTAAKVQKEIGELYEAEGDNEKASEAYQTAADYYQAEENNSTANQMLLKVAGIAATIKDFKRAVEIYDMVAIASLESNLLKFSVKDYLLRSGLCRLATGEIGAVVNALERYEGMDATFAGSREGKLLRDLTTAFEALDEEAFTEKVREFDEISRLDAQKTSLLLEIKNQIKAQQEDIT
jgi:alpha-soluble NSF attachment protein